MGNVDEAAVNVLDPAPAVYSPFDVANCEIQIIAVLLDLRHDMCKEAVARLDLAENDIIFIHFVSIHHGIVEAPVV